MDLTELPIIGRFIKWKHSRSALQIGLLLVGILVIYDGLFGPQLAPRNLAGVLPWIHWRAFVVLGLLIVGNLFCMACPFMFVRKLAKKFLPGDREFPFPSKWLAVVLMILFFWTYESFDLWSSPWWTAWLALGYFAAAFIVDGFFKRAAFCKYLCPIGQFHFVHAVVSPFEIKVKDPSVCKSCTTKDCITGRYEVPKTKSTLIPLSAVNFKDRKEKGVLVQQGCEYSLFQPEKKGNVDCTFCMDCIKACPYDNIGFMSRMPMKELWRNPVRSGVGLLSKRTDLAALVLVLVYGALLNAFGMVPAVYDTQQWLASALGTSSEPLVLGVLFLFGMFLVPLVTVGGAAFLSKHFGKDTSSLIEVATHYSFALIPLGFGVWLAHYLFHFFTGALTIFPVLQEFLIDFGVSWVGQFDLVGWAALFPELWMMPMMIVMLFFGLLWTLYSVYRITAVRKSAFAGAVSWMCLSVLLFFVSIWVLTQPMEMRGVLL